jgi:hypothetical protein
MTSLKLVLKMRKRDGVMGSRGKFFRAGPLKRFVFRESPAYPILLPTCCTGGVSLYDKVRTKRKTKRCVLTPKHDTATREYLRSAADGVPSSFLKLPKRLTEQLIM